MNKILIKGSTEMLSLLKRLFSKSKKRMESPEVQTPKFLKVKVKIKEIKVGELVELCLKDPRIGEYFVYSWEYSNPQQSDMFKVSRKQNPKGKSLGQLVIEDPKGKSFKMLFTKDTPIIRVKQVS